MRRKKWGVLLLLFASQVLAQPLALQDAVNLGLEHSRVVAAAEQRAEAAQERVAEARGYRLPKLDLMEMAARTNQPGEVFGFNMNREENVVGLMSEAFGMQAGDSGVIFGMPNNGLLVDPDPMNTYMTRLQAEMPLFTGGMISGRIAQAKLAAQAAMHDAARARQQVGYDVATSWLDLAKAREYHDLLLRARETTRAHVQMARDYHETGFIVSSEVLRAEVYLAEMEELVTRAGSGAELALAALNFNLGLPQNRMHDLGQLPEMPVSDAELESCLQIASENRQDLQSARLMLEAGKKEEQVATAAFLPTVGVQGNYDAWDDKVLGMDATSWSVKGVVSINLFSGGSDRARVQRAKAMSRSYAEDVSRFEEGVQLQVKSAHANFNAAQLRLEAAQAALEAGRENLRVVEERFRQGVSKMIDLLDAETALRELEVRDLLARHDTYREAFALRHAAGLPLFAEEEE